MNVDAAYQRALDAMYAGYMSKRALVAGLLDREFKNPDVILAIARRLDLLPDPATTVKITGSKGKGTTSRLIAHYLQQVAGPNAKVGLFVSPEEFEHSDRMKINGAEITRAEFVELYDTLRPSLLEVDRGLTGSAYLSPFGIFLLIALAWFKAREVDWHVLETGRGAAHDEVGVLPAELALITSILYEHPSHLGPTLADIVGEKLAIARSSRSTIASKQAIAEIERCGLQGRHKLVGETLLPARTGTPHWLALDDRLARQALAALLPTDDEQLLAIDIENVSAAWGRLEFEGVEVVYDAMISLDSLDRNWFDRGFAKPGTFILYSLPDDKDRPRLTAFVDALPAASAEIVLQGKRGYLHYDDAEKRPERVCARLHYQDGPGFRDALASQIARHRPSRVYCFGTHTFIRLVKSALGGATADAPPSHQPLSGKGRPSSVSG